MRSKFLLTCSLCCSLSVLFSASALAAGPGPSPLEPAAPASAPVPGSQSSPAVAATPPQVQPTNGIVSLSEAAKPAAAEPPKVAALQPEVKPIMVVDTSGKAVYDPNTNSQQKKASPVADYMLMRISTVGSERRAVLLVKGASRSVKLGSRVDKHVVSELRDDGLCLDLEHAKPKCALLIAFGAQ